MKIVLHSREAEKLAELMENPIHSSQVSDAIYEMLKSDKKSLDIEDYDLQIELV